MAVGIASSTLLPGAREAPVSARPMLSPRLRSGIPRRVRADAQRQDVIQRVFVVGRVISTGGNPVVAGQAAGFDLVRQPGLHARIDNGRVAKAIARQSLVRTGIEIPARHGELRDTAPVEAPPSRRPLCQHQLVVLPDAVAAAQRLLPFRIGLGRASGHNCRRIVVNRSRPFHIHRRRRARRRVGLPAVYEVVWRKLLPRCAASVVEGIGLVVFARGGQTLSKLAG
jgi:hypothetical protein